MTAWRAGILRPQLALGKRHQPVEVAGQGRSSTSGAFRIAFCHGLPPDMGRVYLWVPAILRRNAI